MLLRTPEDEAPTIRRFVGNWPLTRRTKVLSQRLEQDLSAGQRDVGAFEANIWGRALGDPRREEIINVCDYTRSERSATNAACVGGMGRHDFIDRYR